VAISHVCMSCGFDLARVEPATDPELNVPLVLCPTCGGASVRRRHPIIKFWRTARRADTALSIMFVQLVAASLLVASLAGMAYGLARIAADDGVSTPAFLIGAFAERGEETRHGNRIIRHDGGRDVAVATALAISAIAGVWLTATLGHLRLWKRWVGWSALLLAAVSLGWLGWAYTSLMATLLGAADRVAPVDAGMWWGRVTLMVGFIVVMLIASPLGLGGRWVIRTARGATWRRQLRRARRSRGRES